MTTSDAPQWLQTATKKRQLRDEAIQRFVDTETTQSEVHPPVCDKPTQADDDSGSMSLEIRMANFTS